MNLFGLWRLNCSVFVSWTRPSALSRDSRGKCLSPTPHFLLCAGFHFPLVASLPPAAANSYYEKSQAGRLSFSVFFLKNVRFYSDKQFPPKQQFFCCHCSLKFSSACRLNKTRTLLFTTDSDFIRLVASCRSFKPVLANSQQNLYG